MTETPGKSTPVAMNYLAHLYLAGDDPDLRLGNFIADHVRGREIEKYDERVREGILMHREIDRFTDSHEVVERSKARLRPRFRKYAPVIVDVYYDHFLAAAWSDYSDIPLARYSKAVYREMKARKREMPDSARNMLFYMEKFNWLVSYSRVTGISRALYGLSRRATFRSNMEFAGDALEEHYELYREEFDEFFPGLQGHISSF